MGGVGYSSLRRFVAQAELIDLDFSGSAPKLADWYWSRGTGAGWPNAMASRWCPSAAPGGEALALFGRPNPAPCRATHKVIKRIARVALSPDVLDNSATLPPQELSPAQAIHLASALAVKRDLTAFVKDDGPLLAAARDAGLPVASPGSP